MSEYSEKFKDPRWQKKRLKILERDNFSCWNCDREDETLHVHHCYYDKEINNPWEYPDKSLITLCESCHEQEHEYKKIYPDLLIKYMGKNGITAFNMETLVDALDESNVNFRHAQTFYILGIILSNEDVLTECSQICYDKMK